MYYQFNLHQLYQYAICDLIGTMCSWRDPVSGSYYDFSTLSRIGNPWVTKAGGDVYQVNIGTGLTDGCPDSKVPWPAAGLQFAAGHCQAKLGVLNPAVPPTFAQIDPGNPMKGVIMTYSGGDFCEATQKARLLKINMSVCWCHSGEFLHSDIVRSTWVLECTMHSQMFGWVCHVLRQFCLFFLSLL